MVVVTFILSIIALIIAILAYRKVGGLADVKKQIDQIASSAELRKSIESMAAATESLRERTAEAIGRLETTFKKDKREPEKEAKEEEKPPKRAPRKRPTTRKKAKAETTEKPS